VPLHRNKSPASQLCLLMTLGPTIALLPLAERARGAIAEKLAVFGRVTLFYYLLHTLVIHAAAIVVSLLREGRVNSLAVRESSDDARRLSPMDTRGGFRCSIWCSPSSSRPSTCRASGLQASRLNASTALSAISSVQGRRALGLMKRITRTRHYIGCGQPAT
jgi:hypothetical protein